MELFEILPACGILTVLSVLSMQAEIDAPQWADLRAEEALAGTIGYVFDTLSLLSLSLSLSNRHEALNFL